MKYKNPYLTKILNKYNTKNVIFISESKNIIEIINNKKYSDKLFVITVSKKYNFDFFVRSIKYKHVDVYYNNNDKDYYIIINSISDDK